MNVNSRIIDGFSKLSRAEKIRLLKKIADDKKGLKADLDSHLYPQKKYQSLYADFSENTVSNYFLPYSLAPNFLINEKTYIVPMVTDESSVVAAAASAAKYWALRGGFMAKVLSAIKTGQVHFLWKGNFERLNYFLSSVKERLLSESGDLAENMQRRGGGIKDIELLDKTSILPGYYQLNVKFDTVDAMGANFINSVLERIAEIMARLVKENRDFTDDEREIDIIMSILSNYAPDCIVECIAECRVDELDSGLKEMSPQVFAQRFKMAVDIAANDIYRAVTHNKGIFNGIDAVLMASGNDYRAAEAQGHAFASRNGKYTSLSEVYISGNIFHFRLMIPLTVGTFGGVTQLHPLAKRTFGILGKPSAKELMQIAASVGLANNFSALKSLVTKGIQQGHMRMHLTNILNSLNATKKEISLAVDYFSNEIVSVKAVEDYLKSIRNTN